MARNSIPMELGLILSRCLILINISMLRRDNIRKIMHLVNTSYKKSIDYNDEYHIARSVTFEQVLENLNAKALDKLVAGIILAEKPFRPKKV